MYIYIHIYYIYIYIQNKTLWPLFVDGVQLPQGYIELLWGYSLLFTRNSWYSLDQSWKDERLRRPWSHPVVLNFYINLVITKYKLKCQTDSIMTLNCELFQSEFSVKNISSAHMLIKWLYNRDLCFSSNSVLQYFHGCSFHYFQNFSLIF